MKIMKIFRTILTSTGVAGALALAVPTGALAGVFGGPAAPQAPAPGVRTVQLKLDLVGDEREVINRLKRAGYSEVRITRSSFSKIRAQGCFEGIRYSLRVKRFGGDIKRGDKIGECRREVGPRDIVAKLKRQGLTRISIADAAGPHYAVQACEGKRRLDLRISKYGDLVSRKDAGRCRRGVDIAEIRRRLSEDGYNRIKLVDRGDRRYVLRACLKANRVRLVVSRSGRIRDREIVGGCSLPINPARIDARLAQLGYNRIKVVDRKLPIYRAEACKANKLMQIRMDRYGDVVSQTRSGECDPPLTRVQVAQLLRRRGANRIQVRQLENRSFLATSCLKAKKLRIRFSRYGEVLNRRDIGACAPPPRLPALLRDFRERGVSKVKLYVEGCRGNQRFRFAVNRYGEVIDRDWIGRCPERR
jgi:hypothetical protein